MLLPHHPEALRALREPTVDDPWRVLVSGCLRGWQCGVDGTDYGMGADPSGLLSLPTLRVFAFCPEQIALGTPRTMPDIHGGDGVDVWAGRARVLDPAGADLTAAMISGAEAMTEFAKENDVELCLLTDMSAACGSQVISDGDRALPDRRYQKGVGVATASLLEAGFFVVSQRDHRTLALLRARLEPSFVPAEGLLDHHEQPWTRENLADPHPRR